ncbi:uncharacterized protein [Physcomitrium patens]|uniref:uncharacterized protein isoform X2 n=1 Tax=Physcomitrium patens TaxID=3218 RepID=UPI000D15F442|nr:uncharacterized protein LOC112295778 isoform X2 [Physcomitrium patens]|eukprot:XP_024403485.1 uncharacterized protein LOC112295778 isoform X2 [Physcomitrella patens]
MAFPGPVLRRTATFSHRQERALQDVNGRVSVVNKSQEHLSMVKSTADGQKVARSAKQYSAVASRYAAPLASKKQPPGIGNEPQAGQSNMTKLPFITGRAAPSHQRRSSTDNLSSFNPPMVFSASRRDTRPDSLAKKAMEDSNSLGAKRPRATMRTSLLEKRTQLQARGPRFYSSDRGGCLCSKKGSVRSSVEVSGAGTVSLLYSAAHWLFLIKLAEEEKKHDVVVELFRLALTLKAEPSEDVKVQLKLYHESHPTDELARRLVEECEGVMQVEMACTTVEAGREGQFNSEESNISVTNLARVDTGVSFGLNSGCSDADLGTPCMQSAPSEENLDFTPNGRQAVKEIDVDSLTKKVVSHTVPEGISITVPESSAAQRNVVTFPVPSHGRRKSWQCIGEQSSIPSAEKSNVFHRHT